MKLFNWFKKPKEKKIKEKRNNKYKVMLYDPHIIAFDSLFNILSGKK
jgi:hypothetical protein